MIKKVKAIFLIVMLSSVAMMLSACNKTSQTKLPERLHDYNLSEYIELGEYKNMEISVYEAEATEAEIDEALNTLAANKTTYEEIDGEAQLKYTVTIDYEGYIDGELFDGGSDTDVDLVLGSNTFIPGFEDQLVGSKKGDEMEINCTFPENYKDPKYAGKSAVFKVKVNNVHKPNVPEVTDEFIVANTEYKTVSEYKVYLAEKITATNREAQKDEITETLWENTIKNSSIKKYPEDKMESYIKNMRDQYTSYASQYGYTLEEYLAQINKTKEEFDELVQNYAEKSCQGDLVMYAVVDAENIKITIDEYNDLAQGYLAQFSGQFSDVESMEKYFGVELLYQDMIFQKVTEIMRESASITYVPRESNKE